MPEHDLYISLHTTRPSTSWPSRVETVSPLLVELKREMKKYNGLVNFAYNLEEGAHARQSASQGELQSGMAWDESGPESYGATLHGINQSSGFAARLSLFNYREIIADYLTAEPATTITIDPDLLHFYVCTHGSRDCRCGDVGSDVLDSLKDFVSGLDVQFRSKIKISEVAHVGGHVWAANVLVYPKGDWFGNIRPADIPALLKLYTPETADDLMDTAFRRSHRRGRMGVSKQDELTLSDEPSSESVLRPLERATPSSQSCSVPFVTYDGTCVSAPAKEGETLMQIAKRAGLPSIEGVCDGKLECATCHLYIPPRPSDSAPAPVPAISEAEEDMLDYAIGRRTESRLGCQIPVTNELVQWLGGGGQLKLPRF